MPDQDKESHQRYLAFRSARDPEVESSLSRSLGPGPEAHRPSRANSLAKFHDSKPRVQTTGYCSNTGPDFSELDERYLLQGTGLLHQLEARKTLLQMNLNVTSEPEAKDTNSKDLNEALSNTRLFVFLCSTTQVCSLYPRKNQKSKTAQWSLNNTRCFVINYE